MGINRKGCTHLVEVYGSLLNSKERKGLLKRGSCREVGKVRRIGWKPSFDRLSKTRQKGVLNLVQTGDKRDIFYTTVFELNEEAYEELLKREMGKKTVEKWKQDRHIPDTSYRPKEIDSQFGTVKIFVIPEEGRRLTSTTENAEYVKVVTRGIEESYKAEMKEANLKALERAIKESSKGR